MTNPKGRGYWFMIFFQFPLGDPTKTLVEVRKGLIEEFRKLKYEAQYIIELKQIKQYPNEIVWYFHERIKKLMEILSFEMSDIQHKEWFIMTLLSHIQIPLM